MKILFCGTNLPEKWEGSLENLSLAGNRYQNTFIQKTREQRHEVDNISFIGIPIEEHLVHQLQRREEVIVKDNLVRSVLKFHRLMTGKIKGKDAIIAYNVIYAWFCLPYIARKNKVKSVLILADYSAPDSFTSILRKCYSYLQLLSIRRYDMVIGLSKNTKRYLRNKQQFLCLEGGIDLDNYLNTDRKPSNNPGRTIKVMYSGLLNKVAGIDLLLKAIELNKQNNVLYQISGQGNMQKEVEKFCSQHENVCFLGKLPYKEYIEELKSADILINPRNMSLPENYNNFPSKMMEYIATGNVIISTTFAGYESFEHTALFVESDEKCISLALDKAIQDYDIIYKDIYDFNKNFAQKFNWSDNVKKIVDLLKQD